MQIVYGDNLLETTCIKCQVIFSGKTKKSIANLSTAKFAHSVVKNNTFNPADQYRYLCKSVEPDEMAHNELSHQDLHCLPFC